MKVLAVPLVAPVLPVKAQVSRPSAYPNLGMQVVGHSPETGGELLHSHLVVASSMVKRTSELGGSCYRCYAPVLEGVNEQTEERRMVTGANH
jgi:hypothetical protein